ncbi:MAG TPA: HAMP domain-containing sensor histidine kinase [Sphingobacteriaceae bacterium]|nr:HAMP domain-containing sensor histidine kinase [Sphingobacteriaceae bacterium]
MDRKLLRRSLLIFYFLFFYAAAQLIWWGILLVRAVPNSREMIIGEGIFFLIIFVFLSFRLKSALTREFRMQVQQRNFLLAVTHELKSPLASIKLYLQTVQKRDLSKEQQQQFMANSLKDIERLDYLVENVLLATKLEGVRPHFPKEVLNFSELIEGVANSLQVNACTSQVIELDVDPGLQIYADRFAITNVVTNLIENAVKYSPSGKKIFVSLKYTPPGNDLLFSVADEGVGIANAEKRRIFDKFYRVGDEGTRKTKGTGLGLYIVKTVLEKHEAQITVRDNHPTGTIFEVTMKKYAAS